MFHATAERLEIGVPVPVLGCHGRSRELTSRGLFWQALQPTGHCLQTLGIMAFDPELLLDQIEAQHWIVAGDPEGGHRIGLPGVAGLHPGGGLVAEPAAPVARPQISQGGKRILCACRAGQSAAAALLHRINGQGGPAPQLGAVAVEPDQPGVTPVLRQQGRQVGW